MISDEQLVKLWQLLTLVHRMQVTCITSHNDMVQSALSTLGEHCNTTYVAWVHLMHCPVPHDVTLKHQATYAC